ncbi:uncharacterized protein LY79DRAFT_527669 [Colletotrichum navitas]|uniref:Uncharacterized protein n=1 Tax=Colletotrichum navitas TaxID=681940 RepID=A0AAD8PMC4_9PEZI|nr:uncharacterized protein LY79DRAFT_527669 [Colletotrichum navitas]KAK1570022.1 hypothetical protein LY79DRAFT_527669 [Colletotrichum navitas]
MDLADEMIWSLSEVGSPSQVLESLEIASVDVDVRGPSSTCGGTPVTAAERRPLPASDCKAGEKSPRSTAHDFAPPPAFEPMGMSFSSMSFYGLRDAVCHSLGKSHLEVACVVDASAKNKVDTCKVTRADMPRGVQHHDSYWWAALGDATLETYIAGAYRNIASFISKADVLERLREARLPEANQLVRNFVYGLVALGAYSYHGQRQQLRDDVATSSRTQKDGSSPASSENSDIGADWVSWRLRAALGSCRGVHDLPSNILKLQMSLLVASIALECEMPSLVTEHITSAVMHIRELGLLHGAPDDVSGPILGYTYMLDVSHALDRGVPPTIDCDWVGVPGPSKHVSDKNLEGIRCLAAVMHKTIKKQFSPRAISAMTVTRGNRAKRHGSVKDHLRQWTILFPDLNRRTRSEKLYSLPDSVTRLAYCMYHRAVFLVHCPWIAAAAGSNPTSSDNVVTLANDCCIRACLESARQVIDAIPFFFSPSSAGTMLESLLLICYCKIDKAVPEEHRRKCIALTGLCQGSLARISLDKSEIGDTSAAHPVLKHAQVILSLGNP